jgi:hypothetical protein
MMGRASRIAVLLMILSAAAAVASSGAIALADGPVGVRVTAGIDGQDAGTATAARPLRLDPTTPTHVRVAIDNATSNAIRVHEVRVSGRVAGLTFFTFDTEAELPVAPHTTGSLTYDLDLSGLADQATGLIPGSVAALDDHGRVLGSVSTVTDVRGSIVSVYGLFGLALVILTSLSILDAAAAIARHRMPGNRWRRGMRLLPCGLGIGLILVFSLSAVRIWVPTGGRWLIAAAVFATVFFLLGYISPTPEGSDDDTAPEAVDDSGTVESDPHRPEPHVSTANPGVGPQQGDTLSPQTGI